jgi:hypothetical protein
MNEMVWEIWEPLKTKFFAWLVLQIGFGWWIC